MIKRLLKKVIISSLFLLVLSACVEEKYIKEPRVGDVYLLEQHDLVEAGKISYNLVKVQAVDEDVLHLIPNRFQYEDKVYCLAAHDYFNTKAAYTVNRTSILKQFEDKKIVDVVRYYEGSCLGKNK